MRRALTAILAVFYLCISTGVTLRAHFCMGEEQGTDFSLFGGAANEDGHTCDKCGMTKTREGNGCCKDEHKVVKLEQKHVPGSDVAVPLFAGFIALPVAHLSWDIPQHILAQRDHYTAACNGPPIPRSSGTPIYLRVRNFRV